MTQPATRHRVASQEATLGSALPQDRLLRAAFQGHRGAYGDDVARSLVHDDTRCLPCATLDHVFESVLARSADIGVVPIENSLAGPVLRAYDLLLSQPTVIVGEATKHIDHVLIGTPTATMAGLAQVYSHPVALAQCEHFFEDHRGIQPVAWGDTAGAAEHIMRTGRSDWAAIAGRRAAVMYGGAILAERIQDHEENYTRFVIVVAPDSPWASAPGLLPRQAGGPAQSSFKTTIAFKVRHEPGTLVRALQAFAARGVDLCSIQSRPVHGSPFEYVFWIDLVGRSDERALTEAIGEARGSSEDLRILGSYPRWTVD